MSGVRTSRGSEGGEKRSMSSTLHSCSGKNASTNTNGFQKLKAYQGKSAGRGLLSLGENIDLGLNPSSAIY